MAPSLFWCGATCEGRNYLARRSDDENTFAHQHYQSWGTDVIFNLCSSPDSRHSPWLSVYSFSFVTFFFVRVCAVFVIMSRCLCKQAIIVSLQALYWLLLFTLDHIKIHCVQIISGLSWVLVAMHSALLQLSYLGEWGKLQVLPCRLLRPFSRDFCTLFFNYNCLCSSLAFISWFEYGKFTLF